MCCSPCCHKESDTTERLNTTNLILWNNRIQLRSTQLNPKILQCFYTKSGFNLELTGGSDGKASAYNAGDLDSIPGLARSLGEGNVYSLQFLPREFHGPRSRAGFPPWRAYQLGWWALILILILIHDWALILSLSQDKGREGSMMSLWLMAYGAWPCFTSWQDGCCAVGQGQFCREGPSGITCSGKEIGGGLGRTATVSSTALGRYLRGTLFSEHFKMMFT